LQNDRDNVIFRSNLITAQRKVSYPLVGVRVGNSLANSVEERINMDTFCFGAFARFIKEAISVSNEEAINLLFNSVVIPASVKNTRGDQSYQGKKEASLLVNCQAPIPREIKRAADSERVRNTIIQYFKDAVTSDIGTRAARLIENIRALIETSNILLPVDKESMLALAKEDTLAEFLALAFTHTLHCPNKPDKKRESASAPEVSDNQTTPTDSLVVTESRPLQPSHFFRGRGNKLAEIKGKLTGKAKLLILNGMGGIGKTEVCRKLYHEALNNGLPEINKLGWLTYSGSLEQTMFRQFSEIRNPSKKSSDYLLQAQKYINSLGAALLLFVDNVNEMTEKETAWLLRLECKVIMTSRRRNTERIHSIEIGRLELADCRILYRQHLNLSHFDKNAESVYGMNYSEDSSYNEDLDAIITMAEHHTLAVELLAKTQRASQLRTDKFRQMLEEKGFSADTIKERITYVHNPESEEDADWEKAEQVLIEQFSMVLDITGIKGEKLRIMKLFSLLNPEAVPSDEIREWFEIDDFDNINSLTSGGWLITGYIGQETPGLAMHPLVSSVVRHRSMPDEDTAKPLMSGLINSMSLPDDELFTDKLPFVKHAVSVANAIDGTCSEYPDMINHATHILLRAYNYKEAEVILQKALKVSDDSFLTATSHNNMGFVYELQGRFSRAIVEYEKAQSGFLATVGKNHRDLATSYNNIAGVYTKLGKYKEALEYFKTAAEIREHVLGSAHPITQLTHNNMAVVYSTLGDYDTALSLLVQSKESSERALKPGHHFLAVIYGNIAEVFVTKGEYGAALEWQNRALDIFENTIGKSSPDTANCYNNLGQILANKGDYKTAFEYYDKALSILIKTYGENHLDTMTAYTNIGQTHNLCANYADALDMAEKVLEFTRISLGDEHLNTALAYSSVADVYNRTGKYEKAAGIYKKSLSIRENILGRFHPDIAVVYNDLADVYNRTGAFSMAVECSEKALEILGPTVGLKHRAASAAYNNTGNAYMHMGEYYEAEKNYLLALSINTEVLGEEHPDTACDYDSLGGIRFRFADYQKAMDLYVLSMRIKERTLGVNHPKTAVSCSNIAGIYDTLGDYKEARKWYMKAFKIRNDVFGRNHPDTAFSLNSLAGVDSSEGSHRESLEGYKEVLVIREGIYGRGHPNIAAIYNNIAFEYDCLKDYKNAVEWHVKALRIKEASLGLNHPSTAISYCNIAAIQFDLSEYDKAKEYYEKALCIREEKLGKDHPDTALIYHALGCILNKLGNSCEALPMFEKAYSIRCERLGAEHPATIDTLSCIRKHDKERTE
jgi:tetratricopeptide (TPR) repeat protein